MNFYEITDIYDNNSQYPNVCVTEDNKIFVAWQEHNNKQDKIFSCELIENKPCNIKELSNLGQALTPVNYLFDGVLWTAWTEFVSGKWQITANYFENNEYSENIIVQRGDALFYPTLSNDGKNVIILWVEQFIGKSKIAFKTISKEHLSNTEVLNTQNKVYRPSCVCDDKRNLYIVYDVFNGENYDVYISVKEIDNWLSPVKISSSKDWNTRPLVKFTHNKCIVYWYSFGRNATFAYRSADVILNNNKLEILNETTISEGVNWYQDISMDSNKSGKTIIAYTWGKTAIHLRYRKDDGTWSNPVMMSYDDGTIAVHPNVFMDDNDMVHIVWQFANINGHYDRNAQIIYNSIKLEELSKYENSELDSTGDNFTKPITTPKTFDENDENDVKKWLIKNGYGNKKVVFGDIHGQSGMSDGIGELDQFYHFAKVSANLDFTALTDHDCYPDWLSPSEWEWIRTTCRLVNEENFITAFLAYEWTSNEYKHDFGHKNVYYRGNEGEVFRSGDIEGMTPTALFENVKKYNGMAFPHHPAAIWTRVSSATDWNFHDEEVQRAVEIFSRHAPFEYYGNTSIYTKNVPQTERHSVQDALARGYKFAFIGGSDSHQMEHGIEGGILGAFVEENSREDVFDSIYDRTVYATTGARILVSFKINENVMGKDIVVKENEDINIEVSVFGTESLKVEILKNNEVIHVVESDNKLCEFNFRDTAPRTNLTDYYYLRVTQKDQHMAWGTPIWVSGSSK